MLEIYFALHVILPLVRSYTVTSTVTLSPGRILMKFILSLPEMCAVIMCLFGSSTLNTALGRASITVPSNSTTSSFGRKIPP